MHLGKEKKALDAHLSLQTDCLTAIGFKVALSGRETV